jgi:hypothetical protein
MHDTLHIHIYKLWFLFLFFLLVIVACIGQCSDLGVRKYCVSQCKYYIVIQASVIIVIPAMENINKKEQVSSSWGHNSRLLVKEQVNFLGRFHKVRMRIHIWICI